MVLVQMIGKSLCELLNATLGILLLIIDVRLHKVLTH